MQYTRKHLKSVAIAHTLFPKTSLAEAIRRLGFVQADPIRSPARAQDLILRIRVDGYRTNDLETAYRELGIEEDFLYAYGFITPELKSLLHPRKLKPLGTLEKKILAFVKHAQSPIDTKQLESEFGTRRKINAWGGYSQGIRIALDNLHYADFLRVVQRDQGRRIYIPTQKMEQTVPLHERLEALILGIIHILAPVTERTLHEALQRTRMHIGQTKPIVDVLVTSGKLVRQKIDGISYLIPADFLKDIEIDTHHGVTFLAPFDPLVWDRRRFEHLWGWPYRFEAYVPSSKRIRGYYAMPMLWGNEMIGWVNVKVESGKLQVERGFAKESILDPEFEHAFTEEVERIKAFLRLTE